MRWQRTTALPADWFDLIERTPATNCWLWPQTHPMAANVARALVQRQYRHGPGLPCTEPRCVNPSHHGDPYPAGVSGS